MKIFVLFLMLLPGPALAESWLWHEQIKPTLVAAGDKENVWTLFGTIAATSFAHQHDADVRENHGDNQSLSKDEAHYGAILGSGFPGILVATGQLFLDPDNGLLHARALAFTAATHITIAVTVQRERPNGKNLSFPSGHTSSSFATASSLAYAYGPAVGIPALAVATYIGYSRIANNAHWLSDTVAGAGLGIFWAQASARVKRQAEGIAYFPIYERGPDGLKLGMGLERKF